jgi:cytochrome c biogenesis protein CcmG/thiol:disulfide interchange protein DsbE
MAAGMTDLTPVGPAAKPKKRRRALIGAAVVAAAVVVSVVVSLSVGGSGKGASPVHSALIGQPAPALAGVPVTGGHASLAAYRGRWVIVNFFASWCVPCQKETPELVRFAAAHPGPSGPAILGVVYQDDDTSVRSFIYDHRVTWPLLAYRSIDQAATYGVTGIPVTFLVRPDGRVATKVLGGLGGGQLDTLVANAQVASSTSTTATGGP